jgi:hypothetical protein
MISPCVVADGNQATDNAPRYVTFLTGKPNDFYVHDAAQISAGVLDNIRTQLDAIYASNDETARQQYKINKLPDEGTMVAVKCDRVFHRAWVEDVEDSDVIMVRRVDWGDHDIAEAQNVFLLHPKLASMEPVAIHCQWEGWPDGEDCDTVAQEAFVRSCKGVLSLRATFTQKAKGSWRDPDFFVRLSRDVDLDYLLPKVSRLTSLIKNSILMGPVSCNR